MHFIFTYRCCLIILKQNGMIIKLHDWYLMYNKNVKKTSEILRSEITFLMDLYI